MLPCRALGLRTTSLRHIRPCVSLSTAPSPIHPNQNVMVCRYAQDVLGQHLDVLTRVTQSDYCRKHPDIFDASVGMHIRHSLDHFSTACQVNDILKDSKLNVESQTQPQLNILQYDVRGRGTLIETDLDAARAKVADLVRSVEALQRHEETKQQLNRQQPQDEGMPVSVEFIGDAKKGITFQLPSNIFRELAFVAHHGIHHLTVIQIMLKKMGYQQMKDVGVAPSTLHHHSKEQK